MIRFFNYFALLAWLTTVLLIIFNYNQLPDQVPSHYNIQGKADSWSSKEFIFFIPILAIFLWHIMSFIEKFPQFINMPGFHYETASEKQIQFAKNLAKVLNIEVFLLLVWMSFNDVMNLLQFYSLKFGIWEFVIFMAIITYTMIYYGIKINRENKN